MTKLRWLGHAAFVIEVEGFVILIDPWVTNPLSPYRSIEKFIKEYKNIDLIIVTHDHGDHIGESIDLLKIYNSTRIVAVYELAEDIGSKANAINRTIATNIGGPVNIGEITLIFTEAVHSSRIAHPSGVIIMSKGCSIYHAGDTGLFMGMKLIGEIYKPIVALLPIGGWFTMGVIEAVKAIELIHPMYVIPMHYNTFDIIKADVNTFVKLTNERVPRVKPLVLRPGEEISLE